jgi:hypothetical protein
MIHGTKFCSLCLKLSSSTILKSSLSFYRYQNDERALPGYLPTRCSFLPSRYKASLAFPQILSLYFYTSTFFLTLTLSLSSFFRPASYFSVSSLSELRHLFVPFKHLMQRSYQNTHSYNKHTYSSLFFSQVRLQRVKDSLQFWHW